MVIKHRDSWEDVFGKSVLNKENWKALSYLPEELFTVYHYSKYIGQVAKAGKEAYPIPMYVNALDKTAAFFLAGEISQWRSNASYIRYLEAQCTGN